VTAAARGLKMTEVPTVLSPDGRSRAPHLRSFRDGWRHLRFLMLLAPKWALMIPGGIMGLIGLVLMMVLWAGPVQIGQTVLDIHTMLLSSMLVIVGYQAVTIGFAARIFAVQQEIGPPSRALRWGFRMLNLERGLIAGAVAVVSGLALIGYVALLWSAHGFGPLDVTRTLR